MRKLLTPILLVVVAIFSFFWYTQPAWQDTATIQSDIEEYESALSQINQIQQLRDNLLSRYNNLPDSTLFIMNEILPESVDQVQFLIELNEIATASGLSIQDISFAEESSSSEDEEDETTKPYESTQVIFSVTGSYDSVVSFLDDVEESARLIDIIALSVSPGSEGEDASGDEASESVGPTGERNIYQVTATTYSLNNNNTESQ